MVRRLLLVGLLSIALGIGIAGTPGPTALEAALNDTLLASRNDLNVQANQENDSAALSADGRYLAFTSVANSLDALAVDVNGLPNIYRRDMQTGDTLLIDRIIATNTAATGGLAGKPSISADGNCVAWTTSHTGNTIVAGTLSSFNVFVRNVTLGTTVLANRASGAAGAPTTGLAFEGFVNAACSHVVFNCNSCNALTPGTNGALNNEVYIRELNAPFNTERVSIRDGFPDVGGTPNGTSGQPSASSDGRYVAFASQATNLEAGVVTAGQIYVRDRTGLTTKAVSRNTAGTVGTDSTFHNNPMISADGRFVTWDTDSEIVVPNTAFVDLALSLSVVGPVAGATPVATGPTSGSCFNTVQCFLYMNTISTPNASTFTCTAGCAGATDLTTETGMTVNGQNGHAWIFGTPNLAPGLLPRVYNLTINADNGVNNANIAYTVTIVAPPANGPAFGPGMGTSYAYTQLQDGSFVVNGFPTNVVISCGPSINPTFATTGGSNCGGALPTGITNSPTGSCGVGCNVQISGTPTAAPGPYPVTYRARLKNTNTVIRNLSGGAANGMAINETRRVNKINGANVDSANGSSNPSISADGRMVLFMANATDLVVGATAVTHVFLRDIQANTTEIIDLANASTVTQSNGNSFTNTIGSGGDPIPFGRSATLISSDFRYVAFSSDGTNLVAADAGGFRDVFRRQRLVDAPTTATFTVVKDFIPDNPAPVTIHLACTGGIVVPADMPATEVAPAIFNLTNVVGAQTCTATEVGTPAAHVKNEAACLNIAVTPGSTPSCTITNTANTTATFTVSKDFIPNNAAPVTVHVVCTGGTTVPADTAATEAAAAVFNLTTVPPGGTTCTATEVTTPAGHVKNEAACAAVVIPAGGAGSCTITNTLATTLTVQKDFVPNNAASVTITVVCNNGATVAGTLPSSEAAAAVFQILNVPVGGASCTATEGVPAGYNASQANCNAVALLPGDAKTCTIINTSTTQGQLNVQKDFISNSGASVTISVSCTGGATVAGTLPATEALPAQFVVNNVPGGGTTCTATEAVPVGYTANQVNCAAVLVTIGATSTCTITNTALPNTGTFTVSKDFVPNNATPVTVTVSCTGGAVSSGPTPASEAVAAIFSIATIPVGGTQCTATEAVPLGYTANQAACVNIAIAPGGNGACTITNTFNPTGATLTVTKDFVPDAASSVTISVSCTGGATVAGTLPASEAAPAVFAVTNVPVGGTICTATEVPVPAGYTANQAPCVAVLLPQGGSGSCTITNTLTPTPTGGTFTVNKVFSPASAAAVQIGLVCTAGTVAVTPLPTTMAAPAVFAVNGIGAGNTCTASEVIPAGYTANQAPCLNQALAPGGTVTCTITNTQTTGGGPTGAGGVPGGPTGAGGSSGGSTGSTN